MYILTAIISFLIISSLSIYLTLKYDKNFNITLPLSTLGIILILFVFGIFNILLLGVYSIIIVSVIIYVLIIKYLIGCNNKLVNIKSLFKIDFILWTILYVIIFIYNYNRLHIHWDEFSHWGDVIKALATSHDYSTSNDSLSYFKSYPPGISLFAYFFQVINIKFNETLSYCAVQIFGMSLLLSIVSTSIFKNKFKYFISIIIVGILPLIFYREFYESVYVDSYLSILFGFGLYKLYTYDKSRLNLTIIIFTIAALPLLKDAGKFFSIILIIGLFIIYLKDSDLKSLFKDKNYKQIIIRFLPCFIAIFTFVLVTKMWSYELASNNTFIKFSNPIKINDLADIFFADTSTYRRTVLKNFVKALASESINFGFLKFNTVIFVLILSTTLFYLKNKVSNLSRYKSLIILVFIGLVLYIAGLFMTYAFQLTQYEAIRLASFARYVNIYILAITIFVVGIMFDSINKIKNIHYILIFVIIISLAPVNMIKVSHDNIATTVENRSKFTSVVDKVHKEFTTDKRNVYIVVQESKGLEYWQYRYLLKENISKVNDNFTWSLGPAYYDGDVWSIDISANEWMNDLVENYDYVILDTINDGFISIYGDLFESKDQILAKNIYKVDKVNRKLVLVK